MNLKAVTREKMSEQPRYFVRHVPGQKDPWKVIDTKDGYALAHMPDEGMARRIEETMNK